MQALGSQTISYGQQSNIQRLEDRNQNTNQLILDTIKDLGQRLQRSDQERREISMELANSRSQLAASYEKNAIVSDHLGKFVASNTELLEQTRANNIYGGVFLGAVTGFGVLAAATNPVMAVPIIGYTMNLTPGLAVGTIGGGAAAGYGAASVYNSNNPVAHKLTEDVKNLNSDLNGTSSKSLIDANLTKIRNNPSSVPMGALVSYAYNTFNLAQLSDQVKWQVYFAALSHMGYAGPNIGYFSTSHLSYADLSVLRNIIQGHYQVSKEPILQTLLSLMAR